MSPDVFGVGMGFPCKTGYLKRNLTYFYAYLIHDYGRGGLMYPPAGEKDTKPKSPEIRETNLTRISTTSTIVKTLTRK